MRSRAFLVVLGIGTATTAAKGVMELVYPPYLAGYGYTFSLIGFLTSLFAVLQLASRLPIGLAYDAERARRMFGVAVAVFGLSLSGFALADGQLVPVVVLSLVQGFAFGSVGTLGLALAIDLTRGRSAGASMAWYTGANSLGYASGALVGGWLAEAIGIPMALGLMGLLPIAAAVAVFTLPPLEAAPLQLERTPGLRGLLAVGGKLDSRVWLAFVAVLYLNVLSDSVDTFFPVFAPTIGISLAAVGVLRAFKSGSALFIRVSGGMLLGRVDHRRVMLVAVVAAAAGTAAVAMSSSFVVLVPVFLVLGLTRGILRATSAATIAELRGEGKDVGLASGVYNAGLDIGGIVGPAIGGALASAFGIAQMFPIVAALSLGVWLLVALSTPTTRAAAGFGKRHTIGPMKSPGGE